MGTNSYDLHRYLSNDEINIVLNEKKSLKKLFDQLKNADGILSIDELKQLTLGLLDDYIIKKIIRICGTKEIGMTCQDFLYFYALLNTSSAQAKLNFILDFIFLEKIRIDKEEYIFNINAYLYNSGILLKIFLNDEIINNKDKNNGSKIKREDIYNYVMTKYSEEIINYKLFKNKEFNYPDNDMTISENNNLNHNKEFLSETSQNPINIINNKSSKINENDESVFDTENQNIDELNNNKNETLVINTENNNSFISKTNNEENKDNAKDTNNKDNNISKSKQTKQEVVTIPKNVLEKNKIYEKMKKTFHNITKEENGTFPIYLFENMLKEINVIQSLIDIIGNFLRQKSQKTFINFQNFKEMINLIIIPDTNFTLIDEKEKEANNNNINENNDNYEEKSKDEIIDGLFTLFAFPKDYISKKNFFLFAKATKPQLNSNTIKQWFNEYKITSVINKKKFKEIIKFIFDELYESFEHIKYLPYIFFKVDIPDKKMEKKCIDVLLKNRSLDEYIQERLQIDDNFYIIDKEFWDKWNLSMNQVNGINNNSLNININNNIRNNLTHNLSVNIENELNNAKNDNLLKTFDNRQNNENENKINNNNESNKINSSSPLIDANINKIDTNKNNANNEIKKETAEDKLKFNIDKIADQDGRLKEGLVYMKDFIVLSSRMYTLFYKWYGTRKDIEIIEK